VVVQSMTAQSSGQPVNALNEMLERARALTPALRQRSPSTDDLRQLPVETVAEIVASGIPRMAQPERFGGMGLSVSSVLDVGIEIRGCGSTAWMATQWPGHNFIVGMFPQQAQEDYWADGHDVLSSTASAKIDATAEDVSGGVRLSGRWKFSSGVDHAQWVIVETPPGPVYLVPRSDLSIADDWFVSGLKGTGSKTVVAENVYVPSHRIVAGEEFWSGRAQGCADYPDPMYRVPYVLWAPGLLVAAVIGMARGALDSFDERVRNRVDGQTFQPAAQRPGNQLRYTESAVEVDSAWLLLQRAYAELAEWGASGQDEVPPLQRARIRRDMAYSVMLCKRAADRLGSAGDASAMYQPQLLHRLVRDIHAASLHFSLTWDEPALHFARTQWGLPPENFIA
jgi:alkylation response protein AidB-like acyl-CoA dehydrogenase